MHTSITCRCKCPHTCLPAFDPSEFQALLGFGNDDTDTDAPIDMARPECLIEFCVPSEFQTPYALDFGKMTQTNKESKSVRSIRRVADEEMEEDDDEEEDEDEVPAAPKAKVQYYGCSTMGKVRRSGHSTTAQ